MPDPERLLPTLRNASAFTRSTPGRTGRLIRIPETHIEDVLICGDLHGHVGHFQLLLKKADLANHPKRHLVFQEVVHSPFRYPNGGDKSHQLLDLFAALKCQYPSRVHLLMGNHEMAQWTDNHIIKHDEDYNQIFIDGIHSCYGHKADEIYETYNQLFAILPLAIYLPNRVLFCHSLPSSRYLNGFDPALLLEEAVPREAYLPKGMLYALVWGRDTSASHVQSFLQKMDADWLISGHITCDKGFETPNEQQIILDSAHAPAACCLLPAHGVLTQETFRSTIQIL